MHTCPVCRRGRGHIVRALDDAARDLEETIGHGHQLMHSTPAAIVVCGACESVFRDAPVWAPTIEGRYHRDRYPLHELRRIHHRAVAEYERDRAWLTEHGLRRGARILEVGSDAGGLLTCARRVGCDAIGVDVGAQTSAFARACGHRVHTGTIDSAGLSSEAFDAVFILNCFEQLPSPDRTLRSVRACVRRGGQVVVRTPNADFARVAHEPDFEVMRVQTRSSVCRSRAATRRARSKSCSTRRAISS